MKLLQLRRLIKKYFAPTWVKWDFLASDKFFLQKYKEDRENQWKSIPIEYRRVMQRIVNMDVAYLMHKNKERLSQEDTDWNRAQIHKMLTLQKEIVVMNEKFKPKGEIVDV